MCHLYCYLVGLIWIWWWKDLPKLSTVSLGTATFMCVHSVVFESSWNDELIIQICLNYSPFNLVDGLFKVMVVMTEKRLTIHHSTTRTHWECEVRMNEMMNGEISLHWLNLKEMDLTLSILAQWFLRVMIWCVIDVDIPKLPSDGIQFQDRSFKFINSLRSFSMLLFVSHHAMLLVSNRLLERGATASMLNWIDYLRKAVNGLYKMINTTTLPLLPSRLETIHTWNESWLEMIVMRGFGCLRWMDWKNWRELWLESTLAR